uniref:AB hydrolase-1 domain-containing protein n=1 Tax=Kalanchoe fedtschenkoi TaxID=63787 RepID=A0A7N0UEB7_KALFE
MEFKKHLPKSISFTASKDWFYSQYFKKCGLRSTATDLGEGTTIHSWVPHPHNPSKPTLLLIHGFGANAMWQYSHVLPHFTPHYNLYVPDLIFFGHSLTTRPDRHEAFQAECLLAAMRYRGVTKMSVVGISYGGFVGYHMGVQAPEMVEKLVLCCTGVCLEEKDMHNGLFRVADVQEAISILLPQTPDKLRELMTLSFVKPLKAAPPCFLADFIHVMCRKNVKERGELIEAILKDRQLSNLPRITQPTMIIWGEEDQVFPLELAFRLQRHVGEKTEIRVMRRAGHALNLEKPKEFIHYLKSFLL